MKNDRGRDLTIMISIILVLGPWMALNSPAFESSVRAQAQGKGIITTVVGGFVGDGEQATHASLNLPGDVLVDEDSDLYIADVANHRIRWVDSATGIIRTVAGNGEPGFSGDGGPATEARLFLPSAIALDASGNLYIADSGNNCVRRVDNATGIITTVAGTGEPGFSGDGKAAIQSKLNFPGGVALDASGNLYISDTGNRRVRRIESGSNVITTFAGGRVVAGGAMEDPVFSFGPAGDGGPATQAQLGIPSGIAFDASGNLFIADTFHHRVRRVGTNGIINTVAGSNVPVNAPGDGRQATSAWLQSPEDVAVDAEGNLYIADGLDHRIRRVDARSGIITTVAGTGQAGLSGDGSSATSARINRPGGVAIDAGYLSIGDRGNQRVRKVTTSTGLITTVVGSEAFIGDGKLATEAGLNFPRGTVVDASNHLYIADSLHHRVRRVDGATGVITTVAGAGQPGFGGDGGPATNAQLAAPQAVAVDASGNLYIADTGNHRVRQVDGRTGIITTVAGTGAPGFGGDGGLAINAHLFAPSGVAIDARRNLFIADKLNHRIRRVDLATGLITTVAGNGTAGFRGDQGSAISASLNASEAVTLDASGNYLFIADTANHRIRQVDRSTGNITTIAGSGSSGNFAGDGGPATQARLNRPTGVAVDEAGNFYIADTFNHRIRRVDRSPEGIITTVAGNGEPGFSGDGQAAVQARLDEPTSVAVDAQGSLYIADMLNHRIRRVSAR